MLTSCVSVVPQLCLEGALLFCGDRSTKTHSTQESAKLVLFQQAQPSSLPALKPQERSRKLQVAEAASHFLIYYC